MSPTAEGEVAADAPDQLPRLYRELASWWPLMSAPEDYEEEAAFYLRHLLGACARPACTLLELGSGGGNNASHLKRSFERVVLIDRSPGMLAVSRALNPECAHVAGDMRTVRLGQSFDCVFVHDAICYLTTEADVRCTLETAWLHCAPGGAALFCPDYLRETFLPATDHGGHDSADGARGLRYLEWVWDPDPRDTTYRAEYCYLLRSEDGTVRMAHDRHLEGLFARAEWLRWLSDAGFEQARALPLEHSAAEPGRHEVLIARRPAG